LLNVLLQLANENGIQNKTKNNIYESSPYLTGNTLRTEPNQLMLFGETVAVCCENHTGHTKTKSKLYYDRQSVGQSVLVSGAHLGPATNFSHCHFAYFLIISGLLMWGALSDEKSDLYYSVFASHRQRSLSQN
jgi:hypothetical protein